MEDITESEYLKQFDKIFGTETIKNINVKKLPLLYTIFKNFGESIYTENDAYKKLREKKIEIENQLDNNFTDEEVKLYQKLWDINNEMSSVRERQLFMFGFIVAEELRKEIQINKE